MKKTITALFFALVAVLAASAQKFALVDMEYIFKNVPSYEMANEQLNQLSQRWQKEVEAIGKQAETMYNNYISDKVFLTDEQIKKSWQKRKRRQNCALNISVPKANSTRNARPFSNPFRTMSTTP